MTILVPENGSIVSKDIGKVKSFQITRNNLDRRNDKIYCSKCLNEITEQYFHRGVADGYPVMLFHSSCIGD